MKIVNIKNNPEPPWIYCGRRMGGKLPREASPLGNPFKLRGRKPADVARCLADYREWLWGKIQAGDPQVMALLNFIDESSVLGCYCVDLSGGAIFTSPEQCHAQLVWKAWLWLKQQRKSA